MFNSEKFNFKYEGYELSERKFKRNEETLMKTFKSIKSDYETLNKKKKGKTFAASIFGKKNMTTNEDTRHTELKKVSAYMNDYGEVKNALSSAMSAVMKNFAIGQYKVLNSHIKGFDEAITLMEKLKKTVSGSASGGAKKRKVKRSVSKKKSDLKKKSKSKSKSKKSSKSKKVSKK